MSEVEVWRRAGIVAGFFKGAWVRIICIIFGGRGKPCSGGEGGGESREARAKFNHGEPPKAARYALGIDHEGVRIKAHPRGAFGPDSFALVGE